MVCPSCGAAAPDDARFCPRCGAAFAAAGSGAGRSRRPVTVVFSDVVDSTALGERLDAETLRRVMERYFAQMRGALERHGGTVEKFIGDAVMAVFGMPTIHEDDALRAVRAADDMRHELRALNAELTRDWDVQIDMRTGVNTGEVVVSGDDDASYVLGSPVNMAARLEQAAGPGEILLGPDTYRLVHGAVDAEPGAPLDLKGIDEPVVPMRLRAVHAGGSVPARGARSPVVGRDEEMELLTHLCRRAAANRRCQLITILGDAGVGKTRLADELVAALEHDVRVLHGRCLPYGEGITFYPVAEALSHAAGIDPGDDPDVGREKLAAVLGPDEQDAVEAVAEAIGLGGSPASPEQTQWAIRRAFESLARERPLVLLFDDLQWAEPTFLDLVESMADRTREVPLILLCTARPELLELRSEWGGGKRNAVTTLLEPLAPDDIVTLATNLLGDGTLDPAAGDRIADASGGNPLFVEEYVSMLVEEGGLRRDGDRWVLPGSALRVSTPPSLAALLAAKLDRLPPDERAVLVYASVIGKVFSTGELEALLPSAHILDLDGTLGRLRDRELIRPAHGAEPGGAPYEFLHLLVRDSAYESLPKATRADLHERFAAWLETSLGPRAEEYQEIVGYHLGQAHRYLRELGSQDPRLDELAAHAADRLGAAGRRAAARGDAPAAQRLLERAADLSPEPAVRADDRLRMLGSLLDSGGAARAPSILRLARDDVTAAGDPGLTARLRLVEANLQILTDPTSTTLEALRATFRDDGEHLARLGDEWSVASARAGEALVAWFTGDAAGMLEAAERALEAALGSGNRREAAVAATYVFLALERGPTPYEGALDRMLALEPALASDRVASAARLLTQADFLATMGRSDEAHHDLDTATSSLADLGQERWLATATAVRGHIAELDGRLADAEDSVREALTFFERQGDVANASVLACDLARILNHLGRHDEAEPLALGVGDAAADYDLEAQVGWRTEAARAAAHDRPDEAERLAAEAVERGERTDFVGLQAEAMSALAEVAAVRGDRDRADATWRRVRDLRLAKGNVVGVRQADAALGSTGAERR